MRTPYPFDARRLSNLAAAIAVVAVFAVVPTRLKAEERPSAVIVPRVPVITALPADEVGRRQALLEIAEQAARVDDAEVAADHADRAFELLPDARSALIAARAHLDRDRWTVALERLLVALDLGPVGPDATAVKTLIEQLCRERSLGYGKLTVTPTDARARLGASELPLGRHFALSAASHVVQVSAPGFVSKALPLTAVSGASFLEELTLVEAPKEVQSITTIEERILEKDYVRFAPLWLTVGGGALVLGGAGAMGASYYYQGSADRYVNTSQKAQVEDNGEAAMLASYALFGIGGAAIIAGAIWWAVDEPPERVALDDRNPPEPTFAAIPWASPDGAGLSAFLQF